ncbi:MAG TPA: hypothetical protein VE709_04740 [Pseudonocardiaceae bacterium]|nr:hypothetical protein [Pseudonocardiaceae bacterium]
MVRTTLHGHSTWHSGSGHPQYSPPPGYSAVHPRHHTRCSRGPVHSPLAAHG